MKPRLGERVSSPSFLNENRGYLRGLAIAGMGLLLAACGGGNKADGENVQTMVEIAVPHINWVRAIIFTVLAGGGGAAWQWLHSKTRVLADVGADENGKTSFGNVRPVDQTAGIISNSIQGGIFGFFASITIDDISLFRHNSELALRILAPFAAGLFGWLALRTDK